MRDAHEERMNRLASRLAGGWGRLYGETEDMACSLGGLAGGWVARLASVEGGGMRGVLLCEESAMTSREGGRERESRRTRWGQLPTRISEAMCRRS